MLQPIANAALPGAALPGALTAEVGAEGSAFVDLLGLLLAGKITALPAAEAGSEALMAAADSLPEAAPENIFAAVVAMLFPAQMPAPQTSVVQLASEPAAETAAAIVLSAGLELAGTSQKKLPTGPADLAAMATTAAAGEAQNEAMDSLELEAKPSDILLAKGTVSATEARVGVVVVPQAQAQPRVKAENADPASVPVLSTLGSREGDVAQTGARVVTHVAAPLLSREWRTELGDRIAWMVGRQAQSAEIILNPPALGSIEVRLNLNLAGNEAGAQFYSANANVRDALESAFPRLRELLANAGIALGEAMVSSQSFAERQNQQQVDQGTGGGNDGSGAAVATAGVVASGVSRIRGLVDLYI